MCERTTDRESSKCGCRVCADIGILRAISAKVTPEEQAFLKELWARMEDLETDNWTLRTNATRLLAGLDEFAAAGMAFSKCGLAIAKVAGEIGSLSAAIAMPGA